jgi:type II secretory pathway component PulF
VSFREQESGPPQPQTGAAAAEELGFSVLDRSWKPAAIVGTVFAIIVVIGLLVSLGVFGLLPLLFLVGIYGWMVFAFLHYRQCRQEELLQVLTAAAEANLPLAPAVAAYLRDRPHGRLREFSVGVLLFFVLPGYYWLWYRRASFDHKIEQLVLLLEAGHTLSEALQLTPGVASRQTLLAAALGEETGQLCRCLVSFSNPARSRLSTLWLEMVPRFAYPLLLLFVMTGILQFWALYIAPKYERILREFDMGRPRAMEQALALGRFALSWSWVLGLVIPALLVILILLILNPGFRWHFPVVGYLYRGYVRSQILQGLSFLLQLKEPAPDALAVLAGTGCFVGAAVRQLDLARCRVESGEPLANSLNRELVLPRAMVPLVNAAERAGNLPWALTELADVLAQRAARRVQRVGMALSPVPVVLVGVLVGIIALGLFVPLIHMMEGLSQ